MTEEETDIQDKEVRSVEDAEPVKSDVDKTGAEGAEAEGLVEESKEPEAAEAPGAEVGAEEEEEIEIVEEKFYDLNLRRIWTAPREKRTPRAVRYVKRYAAQRMKTDDVSLSEDTNSLLWTRGISKPPRKIRIRVVKDKDGKVIVFPGEGK
jgi:large subunit ribosomal protein L31e